GDEVQWECHRAARLHGRRVAAAPIAGATNFVGEGGPARQLRSVRRRAATGPGSCSRRSIAAGALVLTANSARTSSEGDQIVAIHTGGSRDFPLQAAWHPHC